MTNPEVNEESEFDAAFREFSGGDNSDTAIVDDAADEVTDELGEEADADEASGETAETVDPYEGLTEEAKQRYIEMESTVSDMSHRLQSDAGRVSALQRKVNGLQDEIQTIRKGSTSGSMPDENQIKDAMMGDDDEWKKFSEDYPQVAKAIDKRASALADAVDSSLKPVRQTIDKINTDAATSANKEKVDAVSKVFPEWTAEVAKPDFKLWLDDQPPGVQGLSSSPDERDAVTLLEQYDKHLVAGGKPSLRKATDPTEPGVEDEEAEQPSEIERRRARQTASGATIRSKPSGIDASGESVSEFDQAFAHYARKREARSA